MTKIISTYFTSNFQPCVEDKKDKKFCKKNKKKGCKKDKAVQEKCPITCKICKPPKQCKDKKKKCKKSKDCKNAKKWKKCQLTCEKCPK